MERPRPSIKTTLHFARFEFKYVLPKRMRDDVERELQYFLELDPYVSDRENNRYFVRSLYFDDPTFGGFHEKHDGLHTRAKFRVRTYTDDPSGSVPSFLEIKGKHDNLVFKHRALLQTGGSGLSASGNELIQRVLQLAGQSSVGEQFEYELYRKRLKAVALVDYWRRPYISKYDPEFRLTFDEELCTIETASLFPARSDRRRAMIQGYTVLEAKFRHHIPSWFHRIIQSYQLQRVSISKICEAVETLGLAINLS